MGFIGLEKFIDTLYEKAQQNSQRHFMNYVPLKNLKFVVDANQLPYIICNELMCNNQYGGNYDQIYSKAKEILVALKPFIATMIFDGSKENHNKTFKRFHKKISRMANLPTKFYPCPNRREHLDTFSKMPPFFVRMILVKLANELGINYSMSEGTNNHAVACYANGFNKDGLKYTVLSCNTFYYAYNLEKGYLSFKYLVDKLKEPTSMNASTEVPIFMIDSLLSYLELYSYKLWFYFCVLMGSNDIELNRNDYYLRVNGIKGNFLNVVTHLKNKEAYFLRTSFKEIRSTYGRATISKIDILLDQFEFIDKKFKIIDVANDFDRFTMSVSDLKACYLNCVVEDCRDNTVFEMCQENKILEELYSKITDNPVVEYSRLPVFKRFKSLKSYKDQKEKCLYFKSEKIIPDSEEKCLPLAYLNKLNSSKTNAENELTLLYTSLAVWDEWLEKLECMNAIKSKEIFIDSILTNFIIIILKNAETPGTKCSDYLWKILCTENQDFSELINLYSRIIKDERNEDFFENDLKIVHRTNEFQACYYLISIYSQLSKHHFDFLGPEKFLNGLFVCRYIQESETNESDAYKVATFIKGNNFIQAAFNVIKKDLNEIKSGIRDSKGWNQDRNRKLSQPIEELNDLIGKIKI